jgi:hypothetical protein
MGGIIALLVMQAKELAKVGLYEGQALRMCLSPTHSKCQLSGGSSSASKPLRE